MTKETIANIMTSHLSVYELSSVRKASEYIAEQTEKEKQEMVIITSKKIISKITELVSEGKLESISSKDLSCIIDIVNSPFDDVETLVKNIRESLC